MREFCILMSLKDIALMPDSDKAQAFQFRSPMKGELGVRRRLFQKTIALHGRSGNGGLQGHFGRAAKASAC